MDLKMMAKSNFSLAEVEQLRAAYEQQLLSAEVTATRARCPALMLGGAAGECQCAWARHNVAAGNLGGICPSGYSLPPSGSCTAVPASQDLATVCLCLSVYLSLSVVLFICVSLFTA